MVPNPRKRSVKYKHRYSTDAPSQDIVEEETLSPSGNSLQQETTNANVTSQERELGGKRDSIGGKWFIDE